MESNPEEKEDTPDVVVSGDNEQKEPEQIPNETEKVPAEGNPQPDGTEEVPGEGDPQSDETETVPGEGDPQFDETETVPGEDDPQAGGTEEIPGEDEQKPEDEIPTEGDPADMETDIGLLSASLDGEYGIMPVMVLPDDHATLHKDYIQDFADVAGSDAISITGYIERDQNGHRYQAQKISGKWCTECGCFVEGPYIEPVTIPAEGAESHQFLSGACEICGYQCEHPDDLKQVLFTDVETQYDITETTHTEKNKLTVTEYECECGKYPVERSSEPIEDGKPEAHTFVDGVCSVCGYEQEGQPQHDPETHDWKCVAVIDEYERYEYRDNETCIGINHVTGYEYECKTCNENAEYPMVGTRRSVNVEKGEFELKHDWTYENGVCANCGHSISCEHENKYVVQVSYEDCVQGEEEAIDNLDGTHTGKFLVETDYMCDECGMSFSEYKVEEVTAPHEYWPTDLPDESVKCVVCGATCHHEHAILTEEETMGTGEPVVDCEDGATHTYPEREIWRSYICTDCGEGYNLTTTVDEPFTEPHENDGTGYCHACGYKDEDYVPEEECLHRHLSTEFELVFTYVAGTANPTETTHDLRICKQYGLRCLDCQHVFSGDDDMEFPGVVKNVYERIPAQPHEWAANGFCQECGYKNPCAHDNVADGEMDIVVVCTQIPGNATNHRARGNRYTTTHCNTCGQDFDQVFKESFDEEQPHNFVDGVCEDCGYVKTDAPACNHPSTTPGEPIVEASYKAVNDEHHEKIVSTTPTATCDTCGAVIKGETTTETTTEDHGAGYGAKDGKCSLCQHECGHNDGAAKQPGEVKHDYTATDAAHTDATVTSWTCSICGKAGQDEKPAGEPEKHSYELVDAATKKYKCSVCQHVCTHEGATETEGAEKDITWVPTPDQHTRKYKVPVTTKCQYCPYENTEDDPRTDDKAAGHDWEDGVCATCGYECLHDTDATYWVEDEPVQTWSGKYDDAQATDSVHVEKGTEVKSRHCAHCGVKQADAPVDVTRELPHTYKEDAEGDMVCGACGHICRHKQQTTADEFVPNGEYKSNGTKGHTASGRVDKVTTCDDCEKELERIEGAEPATQEQPHSFKNGKCTLCGYVKPAPAEEDEDEEQPEVSDEPVFEAVAPGTPVHGVAVGDGTRMATALGKAVAGIQEEYGADTSIVVRDADKILTPVEYKSLNALPVQEQIFVVLSALGYRDEVTNGLSELGVELSREAHGLIGQIALRLAGMSEAERAEFLALLAQYFQANADGQQTEITLEIRVKTGEGYRMERYGFEMKDGAWQFTSLAVAGAE